MAHGGGESRPLLGKDELETIAATPQRFAQLAVLSAAFFLSVLNYSVLSKCPEVTCVVPALTLPMTAPIYSTGLVRFQVGLQALNSLANVRTLFTIPGVVLALWVTERYGFRRSCLLGYSSQLLCAAMAAAAVVLDIPPHLAFGLLLVSQAGSALGVALFTNNLTRLSGDWFPDTERDAAVTAASLAGVAGTVFISLLAPWVASATMSIDGLFIFQVPLWCIVFCCALIVVKDEPPAPPSLAAAVQRRDRRRAAASEVVPPGSLPELMSELRELLYHRNFIALALSSNFVIQMVYTCVIIMGPLLQPCGISPATTGVALAGFSVGSALSPLGYLYSIRGVTPSYFDLQRGWTLLCSLGLVIILAVHRRGESPAVAVTAWSTLGVLSGVLGNSGLTLEHAAEMTFPRPPNVSLTLLTITGARFRCSLRYCFAMMTPLI